MLVQHRGTTSWLVDTITPVDRSCKVASCKQFPIEIVVFRSEAFEGIVLSGASAECFRREALSKVPYTVGAPFWQVVGHFAPKAVLGSLTKITSTYGNEGQRVTETDFIVTKSHLFVQSRFARPPRRAVVASPTGSPTGTSPRSRGHRRSPSAGGQRRREAGSDDARSSRSRSRSQVSRRSASRTEHQRSSSTSSFGVNSPPAGTMRK